MNIKTVDYGVNINKTKYNELLEQSIDTDFTLPDYCANIERVLKCTTVPVIVSKTVNGSQLILDGNVDFCFIYINEDNLINSYEYSFAFKKIADIENLSSNSKVNTKVKIDYVNIRAVSTRRVEIHGAVGISVEITEQQTENIVSFIENSNIFQKNGSINAVTPLNSAEKHIIIEESIELGNGNSAVKNIVRKTANAVVESYKTVGNKVVVKGNLLLKLLYCSEPENKLHCFETSVPFSQITELSGITDECKCNINLNVVSLQIEPKINSSGEAKTLAVQAKLLLGVSAYCDNSIPVVLDVFSNKYKLIAETENVEFKKIVTTVNETHLCKKELEFSDNSINSVADLWGDTYVSSVKCEQNNITVNGTVNINILGFDPAGMPVFFERGIEFEYNFKLEEKAEFITCNPKIQVSNISYNLTDFNKIEIRAELKVTAAVYSTESCTVVTKVDIGEQLAESKPESSAIVLYFANAGEEIWNIAKKFNSSPKDICLLNEINEEVLNNKKTLLIP